MSVQSNGTGRSGRRPKAVSVAEREVRDCVSLMRGEYTISEAADRAGVDRSTVMKLRTVARQGALDALAASRPGVRLGGGPDPELADARAEIVRLSEALKEMARQVDVGGLHAGIGYVTPDDE